MESVVHRFGGVPFFVVVRARFGSEKRARWRSVRGGSLLSGANQMGGRGARLSAGFREETYMYMIGRVEWRKSRWKW